MSALEEIVKDEIRAKGPMTFARFVELALYHPEHGYYSSGKARVGKAGDFYTSPHVSPVYGKLMAELYLKLKESLCEDDCAFVEMGAGEGYLAKDFLEGLKRYHPREFLTCRYIIIERSPGMMAKQQETLGGFKNRVAWHGGVDELPDPVSGVFFSNELVDSFPFHRVRREDDSIKEIYVGLDGGLLTETLGQISTPLLARHFNRIGMSLAVGMTTEVNLLACDWIKSVAGKLKKGYVITVDYGYPAYDYYSPQRSSGTFMCYHRHSASEKPYENIGEQDITAHVDFTSLALEGKEAGLSPLLFIDQTAFLTEALFWFEDTMTKAGSSQRDFEEVGRGLKALVHPEWMGGAFKTLVQSKGAALGRAFADTKNMLDDLWRKGPSESMRLA